MAGLACNRVGFFIFLCNTAYEEGNEAKFKREFFFNTPDEGLTTCQIA